MRVEDINNIASESGVVASLIHTPELIYHSEDLFPGHFTDENNRMIYAAIQILVGDGVRNVDALNIISALESKEATRGMAAKINVDALNDFIETSIVIARHTPDDYKLLAKNVIDMALRRDIYKKLRQCESLCLDTSHENLEQTIYETLDDIMMEYSTQSEVPEYSEVVDDCWGQIASRQGSGYAGIPFKVSALNEYVTIEKSELILFCAEKKGGKSMWLLNCAVDLLRQGFSVMYIDSELTTRNFTARLISHLAGIEFRRLKTGNYSEKEAARIDEAISWIKTRKFTHTYVPIFDQQTVYTSIKKKYHTQGIDVVIIDYFKSGEADDAWGAYAELGKFVDVESRSR